MKNVKAQRVTDGTTEATRLQLEPGATAGDAAALLGACFRSGQSSTPLNPPNDLFLQVLHTIEGVETHRRRVLTADGVQDVSFDSFGPDRWIERAKLGRIDATHLLAIALHATRDEFNIAAERRIVEGWAARLRQAVEAGELTARDPVTLLPLGTLPDGWGWCVSVGDADAFVQAVGMAWTCSGIVAAMAEECAGLDTLAIEHLSNRPAEHPAAPVSAAPPPKPPVAPVSAAPPPKPSGLLVTKQKLIAGLKLDKKWSGRLSHIERDCPSYLPARLLPTGAGRRDAVWDPVIFTELAVKAGDLGLRQATLRFHAEWPEHLHEIEGRLNAEMGEIPDFLRRLNGGR